jgi:hypothetical protein
MGGNSSREYYAKQQSELELNAVKNYHMRVKAYNYAYHGPYYDYIEWCRGQFELECIPQCCRQGPNYRPQYDSWGREIY